MGRWGDIAEWRGPTVNQSGLMVEQRGVVVHIAEGSYEGTISWCRNPDSNVSCHFVTRADGHIAQLIDTDVTAWTQRAGNGHWLSIENEGHTPAPLTDAQVTANARILAKAHQVYGVALRIANDPDGYGLGHHSMGCNWPAGAWGHCDCPGPAIIAQKPMIVARAISIANGGDGDMDTRQDALLYNASSIIASLARMQDSAPTLALNGTPGAPVVLGLVAAIKAIAAKVDIDPAELAAIAAAAEAGAHTGAVEAAEAVAAAVVAKLPPDGGASPAEVAEAVRDVLLHGAAPAAG